MAYISPATVHEVSQSGDGVLSIVFRFSGNAGEPLVHRTLTPGGMERSEIRNWVHAQIQELNANRSRAVTLSISNGETFAQLAPVADVPTAFQIWKSTADRLIRLESYGLTNTAAVADVAALRADVETTYDTAFASQV
jgi:hypothetical protein